MADLANEICGMDSDIIIQHQFVKKYLYMMVVEQLLDDYRQQGYEIKTRYPISPTLRADLFAVRGDERVVIELVDGTISTEVLHRLQAIVANEGFTLRIVDISKVRLEN